MMLDMLQEENFQLKNELSDLKNAFDMNRDILRILQQQTPANNQLFYQIIIRLTTINNEAMLSTANLLQQRNTVKMENYLLNMEVKQLQERLQQEIERNSNLKLKQLHFYLNEKIDNCKQELMAANEERIVALCRQKIKRKYTTNQEFMYQILFEQKSKEVRRLKQHIQELEYRLIVLIKAHEPKIPLKEKKKKQGVRMFSKEKKEIRLLKYALNSVAIEERNGETVLLITDRFKEQPFESIVQQQKVFKRSISWPRLAEEHRCVQSQQNQIQDLDD